jgi:hypothetical protein
MDPAVSRDERLLAEAAAELWRLRRRLVEPPDGDWARQVRGAARHVDRTLDLLGEGGVEVDGHLGAPFDPGLALDVIAYEPTAGLDRETVIEVERPAVYRGDRVVRRGTVIVGVPARPTGESSG